MSAATLFENVRPGTPHFGKRRSLIAFLGGRHDAAGETFPKRTSPGEGRPSDAGRLTMRNYLRGIERLVERSEAAHMRDTLVEVSPREIQNLIDTTARAKARYVAASLELAGSEGLPDAAAVKTLETARERHEAMQHALDTLMSELRQGKVRVQGIAEVEVEPTYPEQTDT